jgi:hypothetical protein
MALRQAFKDELRESLDALAQIERRLEGLKDLAEHDGLHPTVVSTLARKSNSLHYMREDLAEIPQRVAETEARR